jgi:hypothetical protein
MSFGVETHNRFEPLFVPEFSREVMDGDLRSKVDHCLDMDKQQIFTKVLWIVRWT